MARETGENRAGHGDAGDESALVARAAAGDRAAFVGLVERHHGRILAFLERLCGCPHEARDLAQETFVSAYRNLASFRHQSKLTTWLHTIASNHASSAARRRRPQPATQADFGAVEPAARVEAPTARLERAELAESVRAALARLDHGFREVVVLADMESLSYEEIAATLDIPLGTVRSRLHRARLQLRSLLAPALAESP